MEKYNITYNKLFLVDVSETFKYIKDILCSKRSAANFINNMEKCIINIQTMPNAYKVFTKSNKLKTEVRSATFNNYTIFYIIKGNSVELYRLLYSKRNFNNLIN